jgi:hypothetical protein
MVQSAIVSGDAATSAVSAALRLPALAPRTVRTEAPAVAVHADLLVKYLRSPDERRLVELRPWGDRSQLMARCRGPRDHDTETRLLPMVHDAKRSPAVQALRCLGVLYFGPTGLLPRILGEPDWTEATLTLQDDREDVDQRLLLQVQLRVESRNTLRAIVRTGQGGTATPSTMTIRPGDADPLHALLRIGFGTTPWPGA